MPPFLWPRSFWKFGPWSPAALNSDNAKNGYFFHVIRPSFLAHGFVVFSFLNSRFCLHPYGEELNSSIVFLDNLSSLQ